VTPNYWKQATEDLIKKDQIMHKLILGSNRKMHRSNDDAFSTLVRSIIGQQISIKAAENIWNKLINNVSQIRADNIFNFENSALKNCGLSQRKIDYIRDLSSYFINNNFNEVVWSKMDDEVIISELVQVKGVGRWTAEMFLIFYMLRPNVFPVNDYGLKRAMNMHYNDNKSLNKNEIYEISDNWKPWRSVATWYLWQSLNS
tara:strand:+ start:10290 stop:10892 length:603 start_codon:yes stop_codon:yes gene_type:complete